MTMSFTEINTVMPALVLRAGGGESAVGALTAIMVGVPLISQLVFAGFLTTRRRKKPFLLLGINVRVVALIGAALGIARFGASGEIIPVVFVAMTVFALSGAFAGVSYTDLVGKVISPATRRTFFVNRQFATASGLFISAIATRIFLGQTSFPNGYVLLFGIAAFFLLVATGGFWALREPPPSADETTRPTVGEAFRQVPEIIRNDSNMRNLIVLVNLAAPGFTAIPLVTALAHRSYTLSPEAVGTFVIVQILGMIGANPLWTAVIRTGGFRRVVRWELLLLAALFPLSLLLAGNVPLWIYTALYLPIGMVLSAQKLGIDAVLVQISPDEGRALYAGVFGATNVGTALMPLVTGPLVGVIGFFPVFSGAALLALVATIPLRGIWCHDTPGRRP